MRHVHKIMTVFTMAALTCVYCAKSPNESLPPLTKGNGSDVGAGIIRGKLFAPDGKTPAIAARVVVRYKNMLAPISTGGQSATQRTVRTATTDADGVFSIDSIDTGLYVVEGSDVKENMVLFDSVLVIHKDSSLTLPPDTLEPAGAIKGVISLVNGGNPMQVFVLAFGVDRFSQVKSDGTFLFSLLARGKYRLKIISLDPQYGYFDTSSVMVASGDTTNIGTISLPLRIQPKVVVTIIYDTLRMETKLSWRPTPATITKGYNIYRVPRSYTISSRDSSFLYPLNWGTADYRGGDMQPWVDTTFIDKFDPDDGMMENCDYEYYVTMIDSTDNEGPPSDAVRVKCVCGFEIVDTVQFAVQDGNSLGTIGLNNHGDYFSYGTYKPSFQINTYSAQGAILKSWTPPADYLEQDRDYVIGYINSPFDNDDNIYFLETKFDGTSLLCKVLASGKFLDPKPIPAQIPWQGSLISNNILYFQNGSTITKLDLRTDSLSVWKDFSSEPVHMAGMFNDLHNGIVVVFYDQTTNENKYFIRYNENGTQDFSSSEIFATDPIGTYGLFNATDSLFIFADGFCRIGESGTLNFGKIPYFCECVILSNNTILVPLFESQKFQVRRLWRHL